jgi:hypothetical protein
MADHDSEQPDTFVAFKTPNPMVASSRVGELLCLSSIKSFRTIFRIQKKNGGVKSRRRLTPGKTLAVDTTITQDLPHLIKQFVSSSGRDAEKYRIYGSVGQLNWTLAYVPWVAILRREITTSTERLLRCFAV